MKKKQLCLKQWFNFNYMFIACSILFIFSCAKDATEIEGFTEISISATTLRVRPEVGLIYNLRNRNSGRYMEIANASNSNGANTIQGGTTVTTNDTHLQWEVINTSDGFVRLRGVDSRKSLEVEGGSNSDGANVQQRAFSGVSHQEWEILETEDGFFRIRSRDSRKSISVEGGSTSNGANIEIDSWDRSDRFDWGFEEVGAVENPVEPTLINLAIGQSTSQSSTRFEGESGRAVDGNTDGRYGNSSVTHTNTGVNESWEVELVSSADIEEIVVWNRTDNCCVFRLGDFTVLVLNANGTTVWSQRVTTAPNPSVTLNTGGVNGSTIRIVQNLNQALSLAEVQVLGTLTTDAINDEVNDENDFGLNPNLEPWENFDLSDWSLDSPAQRPSDECRSVRIDEDEYDEIPGSTTRPYFFTHTDGGMRFVSPVGGATTNRNCNSGFPRSELREMLRAGNTSVSTTGDNANNWALGYQPDNANHGGRNGRLAATLRINQVTTTGDGLHPGRTIIGQIHASDDEPARLYYRKCPDAEFGSLYLEHEINGGNDVTFNLIGSERCEGNGPSNGIRLDELFSYEIINNDNLVIVNIYRGTLSGEMIATATVNMDDLNSGYDEQDEWMYFKAGVYTQNNTGDPDDVDIATFYFLENSHDDN